MDQALLELARTRRELAAVAAAGLGVGEDEPDAIDREVGVPA